MRLWPKHKPEKPPIVEAIVHKVVTAVREIDRKSLSRERLKSILERATTGIFERLEEGAEATAL